MSLRRMSQRWGLLAGMAWAVSANAAAPLSQLLGCREIPDAAARLQCFDRESAKLAAAPDALPEATAAMPSPSALPAVPAAVPLDPKQQFGLSERTVAAKEVSAGTRAADVAKVEAHIVGYAPAADGRAIFTLDNDQIWRQLIPDGDMLAKAGDGVTVSRGLLGSYWLQLKNGRGCKVTRLH
jgi:hypothetical protein